jgi:hypothetical protein
MLASRPQLLSANNQGVKGFERRPTNPHPRTSGCRVDSKHLAFPDRKRGKLARRHSLFATVLLGERRQIEVLGGPKPKNVLGVVLDGVTGVGVGKNCQTLPVLQEPGDDASE